MAFDQDSNLPPVNLHKKTTQLNVWMVVGILLFFVATGVVVFRIWNNPRGAVEDVQRDADGPGRSP